MTHTCQICAREIKVNKRGEIHHHGYKRPGDGWQTASCAGAYHLPYEQSRNAIPAVIQDCNRQMELLKIREENHRTFLVNRVLYRRADPRRRREAEYLYPDHPRFKSWCTSTADSIAREQRLLQQSIDWLQQRYDAWVPPAE